MPSLMLALLLSADPASPAAGTPAFERADLLKTFVDELVEITPGRGKFPQSFAMGDPEGPPGERPVRTVTFDADFAMAKYEVPQNLYEAVMEQNPSRWKGPRHAAEMMTWQEATVFCARLTQLLRGEGLIAVDEVIRLPTEAEWEYCCRAGTTTAYSFGPSATAPDDTGHQASLLDPYGWHTGNAAGNDPPVGAKEPNPWGLYDMHGYLWEYVADAWHPDHGDPPEGAAARGPGAEHVPRVMRGGSWRDPYPHLRSASRWPIPDHARSDAVGFRCVKARIPEP